MRGLGTGHMDGHALCLASRVSSAGVLAHLRVVPSLGQTIWHHEGAPITCALAHTTRIVLLISFPCHNLLTMSFFAGLAFGYVRWVPLASSGPLLTRSAPYNIASFMGLEGCCRV